MRRTAGAASSFRPDIQGLRAIAVLLVVLYHSGVPLLSGGYMGVDVFFVISGFLITSHIYRGLQDSSFGFASFYARRIRRILPASFAVLVLSLLAAWIVAPPLEFDRVARDAAWTAVYAPNILFAREGTNYLAAPDPSLFQHYWSLGIEEQFYLLWPLILWLVYRVSRRNLRVVSWAIVVLVGASFVGSVMLTPVNQPWAFFLLPTRAWELGVGGIVAIMLARGPLRLAPRARNLISLAGILVLLVAAFRFAHTTPFPSYWAAVPVLATAAIILVGPADGLSAKLLQNRAALWIGAISYSVYLVHWPLLILPQIADSWMAPLPLWLSLLLGALSFPLGWLSYRFIETPFRRGGTGRRAVWMPIIAAVCVAALVAGVSVLGMRSVNTQQLHAGKPAPEFAPTTSPASAEFVGSNLPVRLQEHQHEKAIPTGKGCMLTVMSTDPDPACEYGDNPDAPHVALVGDSHAAQWAPAFEALAESGDIFLTAHTRSGCPLYDESLTGEAEEAPYCTDWKRQVLDNLAESEPDVIVIGSAVNEANTSASDDKRVRIYETGMEQMFTELPERSEIVMLRDTPRFPGDPMSCLSAHVDDPAFCSIDADRGTRTLFAGVDERLAAEHDAALFDYTDYICDDEQCHLVQGDILVYKDSHHLSKSFATAMAPTILDDLRGLPAFRAASER